MSWVAAASLLPLLLLVLWGVCGCEDDQALPPPSLDKQETIHVLATAYPLADVARQIGGDWVTVEWLAESGQPLPGDEPPAEIFNRVRFADVVISTGEPWAVEGFDDPMRIGRVVRLDVLPAAANAPTPRGLMWLDPAVMREAAEEVYKSLSAKRPRLQPHFRTRTDAFVERLDEIVRAYEPVLHTQPPRKALVLSSDWSRLLARFGIETLGLADENFATLTDPQRRDLIKLARQHRITSLFVSTETPPAVVNDLERSTDLTIVPLERLGTSAGVGRNTYLEILRYNLDQLNQGASK